MPGKSKTRRHAPIVIPLFMATFVDFFFATFTNARRLKNNTLRHGKQNQMHIQSVSGNCRLPRFFFLGLTTTMSVDQPARGKPADEISKGALASS